MSWPDPFRVPPICSLKTQTPVATSSRTRCPSGTRSWDRGSGAVIAPVGELDRIEQRHVVVAADRRGVGVELPPAWTLTHQPDVVELDLDVRRARRCHRGCVTATAECRDGLGLVSIHTQ